MEALSEPAPTLMAPSHLTRLRHTLSWSNSRDAWRERLGWAVLVLGGGAWWWFADRLTPAAQVFLGVLLFVAAAVLLRTGLARLLGPVPFYYLVRTTRRSRFALYRAYAYFVLILLALFWVPWYVQSRQSGWLMPQQEAATLARTFANTFLCVQFLAAVLLTPAYTAGILAEEKDRRTLEFLLATDLRNYEIVCSQLLARVANLLLMLLTGLPILTILPLIGGIDPDLVLVAFTVTVLTTLSLACISILNSVYAQKPRQAILQTYLLIAAYLAVSFGAYGLTFTRAAAWTWGLGPVTLSVADLLEGFNVGNPFLQVYHVLREAALGSGLTSVPGRLRDYAVFHGLVAAGCLALAVVRLRAVALRQAEGAQVPAAGRRRLWRRPGVGRWPMVWKEVFAETGPRRRWFGRLLVTVVVLASFATALWAVWIYAPRGEAWRVQAVLTTWSQVMGAAVACLLLLAVAVRAANSLSGERDRQTLDSLLTTPLDTSSLLFAKWLGSILSIRWGWLWLGLIWGLGMGLGVLHPLAVPVLLLAWFVYAGLVALIGLWFSLVSRTGQRAVIWTLCTVGALGFGFVLIPVQYLDDYAGTPWANRFLEWLSRLERGLTPPLVLGWLLPFHREWSVPVPGALRPRDSWHLQAALEGLTLWAVAAVALWALTHARFRKLTCRPNARPPRVLPPQAAVQRPVLNLE